MYKNRLTKTFFFLFTFISFFTQITGCEYCQDDIKSSICIFSTDQKNKKIIPDEIIYRVDERRKVKTKLTSSSSYPQSIWDCVEQEGCCLHNNEQEGVYYFEIIWKKTIVKKTITIERDGCHFSTKKINVKFPISSP